MPFKFDLDLANAKSLGVCGGALLSSIRDAFQGHTTCLQIQKDIASLDFFEHCIHILRIIDDEHLRLRAPVISNYSDTGALYSDSLVALFNQLVIVISNLPEGNIRVNFFKMINASHFNLDVFFHFAPQLQRLKEIDNQNSSKPHTTPNEDELRKQLAPELIKLITLYCNNIGILVIAMSDIDSVEENKNFFCELVRLVPNKLRLIATYKTDKLKLSGDHVFEEDESSIAMQTVTMLAQKILSIASEGANEIARILLKQYPDITAKRAQLIVKNINELRNLQTADHPLELKRIDKYYLLPAEETATVEYSCQSVVEENIHNLCVFLGPFVQVSRLKKIYKHCFKAELPSGIDWGRLGLHECDGRSIRHANLATYDKAREVLIRHKAYDTLMQKISECETILPHIHNLYDRRNELPHVLGIRNQCVILNLLGIDANPISDSNPPPPVERSLSTSSEKTLKIGNKDSDSPKSPNYDAIDVEIILSSIDELITYHSARADMVTASTYCNAASTFLDDYHGDYKKSKLAIEDLAIAKMVITKSGVDSTNLPYGKLKLELYVPLVKLLINMGMFYYFTEKYEFLRRCLYQAYILLQLLPEQEKIIYRPIIEACLALILTHCAETRLREKIKTELHKPARSQTSLPKEYAQLRHAASVLFNGFIENALSFPFFHERPLSWTMAFAVPAKTNEPFSSMARYLKAASSNLIGQENHFKRMLAWGNSLLSKLCAADDMPGLKRGCEEFIEECEKYKIELPVPIIKALLAFVTDFLSPAPNINLIEEPEGPNRFFIVTIQSEHLLSRGENRACVKHSDKLQQQEFKGVKYRLRDGYCIYPDFLVVRAIALLRYLKGYGNRQSEARVKARVEASVDEIIFTIRVLEQYAREYPINFECRYEFLRAEVLSSELSQRILGCKQVSLRESVDLYNSALAKAKKEKNEIYRRLIRKAHKKVEALQQKNIYSHSIDKLINEAASDLGLLFIKDTEGTFNIPKVLWCTDDTRQPLATFIKNKAPDNRYWCQDVITQSLKHPGKLTMLTSAASSFPGFLRHKKVNTILALPFIDQDDENHVVAILYLHSLNVLSINDDDSKPQKLIKLAQKVHDAALEDLRLLDSPRSLKSEKKHHVTSSAPHTTSSVSSSQSVFFRKLVSTSHGFQTSSSSSSSTTASSSSSLSPLVTSLVLGTNDESSTSSFESTHGS